jgi:hypothetical protein
MRIISLDAVWSDSTHLHTATYFSKLLSSALLRVALYYITLLYMVSLRVA